MLKRTPLYELHRAAGAKMVDFGGWEMPLHYGSQIDEHHAVRRDAGMFDVSHMRAVDLSGHGVLDFLRRLLANDAAKLTGDKAMYTCMLNPEGGVLDDLIVYRNGNGIPPYRTVVNAATADRDIEWMRKVIALYAFDVTLEPRPELALIAVQGPRAREALVQALPAASMLIERLQPFTGAGAGDWFIARTGYTGEDGFELVLPAAHGVSLWRRLSVLGVKPCGLGARDTLRLEAGMNLYGQDMDETVTPLESGLAWTVDLKSARDFIGREALDRQLAAGGLRKMVGLKLLDRGGVLRSHLPVTTGHGMGEITSGTFSPTLGCSIALARVPAGAMPGEAATVELRGKPARVQLVKYPFVRNGQALV
jgi:aminomethyltransferase